MENPIDPAFSLGDFPQFTWGFPRRRCLAEAQVKATVDATSKDLGLNGDKAVVRGAV